ncbi:MAG: hypothetical protein J6U10_01610 [Lachnospiraceae bacterium]|nr:hypothetical protein [Lachnospiraceae bacterium]
MKLARSAFAVFLFIIVIMTAGRIKVRADGYDFRFSLSATVNGTAGEYLSGQVYTLSLGSTALARPIPAGTDISSWFSGKTTVKPAGMKVVVYEDAEAGAKSIKIEFKGLVYGASQDEITMHVQIYYFDSSVYSFSEIADVTLSGGAKYNVIRNFTKPSGYSGVGYGIYFDMSQNNGNGFKLHGTKNVELTGSGRELNVVIDGCFLQTVPKGKDITSWFTGHVSAQNLTYNTSLNSQLPPGITVKIKNTVNIGDNSFTMVFSGTPTKGSKDLIAITIPAGYVTYNPGVTGDVKGDKRDALKTYNVSGHFVYDIESPDNDYKSIYILATYPDTTLHAGSTYTEADGLKVTYQLVGTDSMGNPYTFKDIQLNHNIKDYIVQNVYNGERYEPISRYTGLTPTITYISDDRTYMEATITGKATKNIGLLLPIGTGSGMQLLHSYSTYGQYIDVICSEETHLYFGQPDPQITMSKDIEITATVLDQRLNFSATEFTINLGNDTLAKSFNKGDSLAIFAYKSTSDATTSLTKPEAEWKTVSGWNGIYVRAAENTPAGSSQIKVYLDSESATVDYYGYVYLAFPREYLTNAMAYGATGQYVQLSYPLKENRIFVNVEKYEYYYAKVSFMTIEGSLHMARLLQYGTNSEGEIDTRYSSVAKSFEGGIASNKVYFTVTTLQDINVPRDYAAGESVKDLFHFSGYMGVDPYYNTNPFYYFIDGKIVLNTYWQTDYYYDIRTAKPITKDNDGEKSAHTFELYIDLSEFRAKQACHEKLWFEIKNGSSWEKVYTTPSSVFNIEGEWFETHDPDEYQEFLDNYAKTIGKTGTGTSGSIANTGIVYSSQSDVILYAKDASGNDVPGTYINMTKEQLVSDFAYDCYSIDGGTKWKAVTAALTDKQIASMLNKGMTLVLADKFDKKAKKPSDDATVYTFATINKRATAPKLKAE